MSKVETILGRIAEGLEAKANYLKEKSRVEKYYSCGFIPKQVVDRVVITITKKGPFLDWANSLPDAEIKPTLADVNCELSCYLLPHYEKKEKLLDHLESVSPEIFELEMKSWWKEEVNWEKEITWEKFNQWFDYTISSLPVDMGDKYFYKLK